MMRLCAAILVAVLVGLAAVGLGAVVGGSRAPDGTEVQCDLPVELHRRNTTSRGQGCCVWTSIHHAALWQNVAAYQEAPRWIQEHGVPGGVYPGAVEKYLPEMARQRGNTGPGLPQLRGRRPGTVEAGLPHGPDACRDVQP